MSKKGPIDLTQSVAGEEDPGASVDLANATPGEGKGLNQGKAAGRTDPGQPIAAPAPATPDTQRR